MKHQLVTLLFIGFGILSCAKTEIELQALTEGTYSANAIATAIIDQDLINGSFRLIAKTTSGKTEIPYQKNENKIFWKTLGSETGYSIEKIAPAMHGNIVTAENEGQFEIFQNNKKILGYQMAIKDVPEGVSENYKRSGYLHPVNTPKGKR